MHFSLVWMLEDCALASAHTALSGVYANTSPAASPPRAVAVALRSLSVVVACENCEHHSCHFPSWKDLNKGQEFQFEGVRSGNLMLRRGVDTLRISPRPPCPCTEMLGFANSWNNKGKDSTGSFSEQKDLYWWSSQTYLFHVNIDEFISSRSWHNSRRMGRRKWMF